MHKLIRMDLYRMLKSRSFLACLLLAFLLAAAEAPLGKLMVTIALSFAPGTANPFTADASLSAILSNPFPMMGLLMALLSLCWFFYADMEHGYIKNIAGQMPMKGFTILSRFLAAAVHNLVFAAVGILGNLAGTLLVQRIAMDAQVLEVLRILALKLLLAHSLCAALLLVAATFRSKSFAMVLAVLLGLGLTPLLYAGISEGLGSLLNRSIDIAGYMPDTVMGENPLGTGKALAVALAWGAVFLVPAVRIFDRKDVK